MGKDCGGGGGGVHRRQILGMTAWHMRKKNEGDGQGLPTNYE